jgi:hypothetical protein
VELPEVLLVPANPLDLRPEDLEPLAIAIGGDHALAADVGVVPQRGYGVTWWEVLYIYLGTKGLDALTGHAFQLLLDGITEKAKQWYRGRRDSKDNKRPFYLGILDEEGRVLRALEIRPDGSTEDVTGREQSQPPKPRPEPADGGEWQSPE